MVEGRLDGSGSRAPGESRVSDESRELQSAPFVVTGDATFVPTLHPETIRVRKQRNLNRQAGFCGGEDVSDNGSKNRNIHITGKVIGELERENAMALADSNQPLTVSSSTWSGEVRVKEVEVEGPSGWYPPRRAMFWEYTIDLVSTGRDEQEDTLDEIVEGNPAREDFEGEDELRGV